MNLLPIPWMKLKLESIYDVNLYGNLYLIFNDINYNYNIDTNSLSNLLVDHNILVDDSHPLYLYLQMELNDQIYKLMTSFKYLYKDNVYINLGSVYGISVLKYIGPKFKIELETSGNIETNLKNEFQSVGINQTLHKLILNVTTKISVLTPFGSFGNPIESNVLLVESVIVGEIPDTYYDFNGEAEEDKAFEVMQ